MSNVAQQLENMIVSIRADIAATRAELAATRERLAAAERAIARAPRGVAEDTAPSPPTTPKSRAEAILSHGVTTPEHLARALGVDVEQARALVPADAVNLATDAAPRWVLPIGDQTDFSTLIEAVRRVLRERPMTQTDIVEATGARRSRVGGAIGRLQARGENVINLGNGRRARWFLAEPTKP